MIRSIRADIILHAAYPEDSIGVSAAVIQAVVGPVGFWRGEKDPLIARRTPQNDPGPQSDKDAVGIGGQRQRADRFTEQPALPLSRLEGIALNCAAVHVGPIHAFLFGVPQGTLSDDIP